MLTHTDFRGWVRRLNKPLAQCLLYSLLMAVVVVIRTSGQELWWNGRIKIDREPWVEERQWRVLNNFFFHHVACQIQFPSKDQTLASREFQPLDLQRSPHNYSLINFLKIIDLIWLRRLFSGCGASGFSVGWLLLLQSTDSRALGLQ